MKTFTAIAAIAAVIVCAVPDDGYARAGKRRLPVPPPVFIPAPPPIFVPVSSPSSVLQELPQAMRADAATALRFAQLYSPTDIVKANAMALGRKSVVDLSAADSTSIEMEKRYPGLTVAAADAAASAIGIVFDREMPNVHQRLANIMQRYFSQSLAENAVKFYGSDTGRTIIQAMAESANPNNIQNKIASNPEAVVSQNDIVQTIASTGLAKLSNDQIREAARFNASPAGLRLQRTTPFLLEELTNSVNQLIAQQRSDVQAAMMQTIAEFQRADEKKK